MSSIEYWVGFNLIPGIGPAKVRRLLDHFGDLEPAWNADAKELGRAGLDAKAAESLVRRRPRISLETEMEKLERLRVRVLTWEDPAYPSRLREIYDAPPVLYVRGSLLPSDEWCIAVVGTRKATAYGREATHRIVGELARNQITIVSGLARGIDAEAHRATLEAGGRTIAVLACGLDMVYPSDHLHLAREIMESGALLSDYPIGTQPTGQNFPPRNRIMSGLSLGVLVVEAGERSGALITARYAVEQNRDVFAVPGGIFAASSRGVNRLIQDGAKLVQEVQDILEELNLSMAPQQMEMKALLPIEETELMLLRHLSQEPTHIDAVRRQSGLPIATVSSTLALMELKGMVRQVGAMNYVLAHEKGRGYEAS